MFRAQQTQDSYFWPDFNNTKITFSNSTIAESGQFSLFFGHRFFHNVSVSAVEAKFSNANDVGLLYYYDGNEQVTVSKVNVSGNVTSSGNVCVVSLQALRNVNVVGLFVNGTEIHTDRKASLLFNEVAADAVVSVQQLVVGNATRVHGKTGIGGLVTACSGVLDVTQSSIDMAVVAEDVAASSAFVY